MDGKQSDRKARCFAGGPRRREAPQVIVVVPHFFFLQAVTQLERCDQRNMAEGEAGKREGVGGGSECCETRGTDCSEGKRGKKEFD